MPGDVTDNDELEGVDDPAKPPIVITVAAVQVVNKGTEGVNVMVKVLVLHGFEVDWIAVAVNTNVRR